MTHFEWDIAKAKRNWLKHGISFADVELVFHDDFGISMHDPDSADEFRFLTIGTDALGRVLTVSYTYRGESIRIVSARRATQKERREYAKRIRLQ